jgi:hypothetical protein
MIYGTLATLAALFFGLNRSLKIANWSTQDRGKATWAATALITIFYFAALIPSRSSFYAGPATRIPTIQYGILTPIVIGTLLFLWWRPFHRVVEAVPQQWLVGLQFFRVEGVIFLILYAAGRLPRQFAWPAGIGDVLVGLLAPVVALAHLRNPRHASTLLRAWNLLGLADLAVAITTGLLTSPGPFHLLALDTPNLLISRYPLAMIPVFLVPLAILLHLASLRKLRQERSVQQPSTQHLVSNHG